MKTASSFAPATIANLACGFDVLGLAIDGLGDTVTVTLRDDSSVVIDSVEGDAGRLSLKASENTAGVAVLELKKLLKTDSGFGISVKKGLPLGSGLGSSAASGVAALLAANALMGNPLSRDQLLPCAMEAERAACGSAHADNVAPALLGGIVLIRSYDPLDVIKLSYPSELACVVVTPDMELKTSDARAVLPKEIALSSAISQWGNVAGFVTGLLKKDLGLISRSLKDEIVEPKRAPLIPGFYDVKQAALISGALGCSISGSGPSVFALVASDSVAQVVMKSMQAAFMKVGLSSNSHYSKINAEGARLL